MLPVTINRHSAGGRSNGNQLLDFDILLLLGDKYGLTIYKNNQRTTATPFSNKVSAEIRLQFFR